MKKWVVRDREEGIIIEWVDSVAEGELLIRDYEQQDMDEGVYTPNFYECVEVVL